jgi:galactose-1-phosphate uridylyltransferase
MKPTLVSELRRDIVSGAWVVIAIGRGKRPHDFLKQKQTVFNQQKNKGILFSGPIISTNLHTNATPYKG